MDWEGIDRAALDRLYCAAMEAAIARIEKDGSFHPLLFELRPGGAVQAVAVLDTGSVEGQEAVLERLCAVLRPRGQDGAIDAAAIAVHHAMDQRIEIRMRARGHAADIVTPYALATYGMLRRRRRVTLARPSWRRAENTVFP